MSDLALVDNGSLTSMAVFRAAARPKPAARNVRCPDSPCEFASNPPPGACLSRWHRRAAIGISI